MGLCIVQTKNDVEEKKIEQLYDFADLALRILELYEEVRIAVSRDLLLNELHMRMRHLNGAGQIKKFQPYLVMFQRILTEIPSRPEHVEAAVACAEQLKAAIEQAALIEATETPKSSHPPRS